MDHDRAQPIRTGWYFKLHEHALEEYVSAVFGRAVLDDGFLKVWASPPWVAGSPSTGRMRYELPADEVAAAIAVGGLRRSVYFLFASVAVLRLSAHAGTPFAESLGIMPRRLGYVEALKRVADHQRIPLGGDRTVS